jgi:cytochrome d ubiquinol oxidase subunit I
VAFLVAGVSAFRWLIGDRSREVRTMLKTGVALGALLIPVQIFRATCTVSTRSSTSPQKVAAMEGNWETGPRRAAGVVRHPR